MDNETQSVIAVLSAESETLTHLLLTVEVGDVIPYAALSAAIGRNVQTVARGNLATARNKARREESSVFEPVRGVGLKRLTDGEITHLGDGALRKINRVSWRGMNKLVCVQHFAALTPVEKNTHNAAMSLLGVFYQVSKAKSVKQIASMVAITQQQLPLQETLKTFLK